MRKLIRRKFRTLFNLVYNKPIGTIYMLHRVHPFEKGKLSLNENMKVSPEFLERFILERLDKYEFLSLDQAIAVIEKKIKLTKPFIVFTFDDGYADNYTYAYPIFKKYNIPFIIYIATGLIDRFTSLWWYQLEDIIMYNNAVSLSNGMYYSCDSISEKETTFLAIRRIIQELPSVDFEIQLRELLSGYSLNFEKYTDELMLTWHQILELSKSPICTIGAHTVTHSRLSNMSITDLNKEITESKSILEDKIKQKVDHFAYPFGTSFEVNDQVVHAVEKSDFISATNTYYGVIRKMDKELFRLKRIMLTETKMKILSVSTSDASGGAARAAWRIHQAVKALGTDSWMLVKNKMTTDSSILPLSDFAPTNSAYRFYEWIRSKIKNKIQHYRWNNYPNREDVFMSDLRSVPLHGALQQLDFDVLHIHWVNLRYLNLNELRKVQKPIVWTLHDCWAFTGICHYFYDCERYKTSCGNCPFLHSGKENDLSAAVWRKKQKIYDGLNLHIVTPSNWLAEAARESALFGRFPVTVIPNPIDTGYFAPGSRQMACELLQLNPDKKYILFGAMNAVRDKNKGFNEFISAMRQFEKIRDYSDVELIIFGADEKLEALNVSLKVHNLGTLHDQQLIAAYRAASVMVVPSLSENLSNIVMESLSCSTPVVAFNIGGNSDMIDHKQNGYLAEPFNPEDLAAGIAWCLDNNANGELSRNARTKVEANYSMERVGEKYVELYKELIK